MRLRSDLEKSMEMQPQQGFAKLGMVRQIEATMGPRLRAAYPVSREIPEQFVQLLQLLDSATGSAASVAGLDIGDD
jgi:hypothetical protein